MQANNPFDKKLELVKRMPEGYRAALTEAVDTLEFSWLGVQAVFEDRATPEHALKLCELVMAERARLVDREERDR